MLHPLLLLPRPVDRFVLGDHARQLAEAGAGAYALPGRVPYGALVRAPAALRGGVAASIARSLERSIPAGWADDDLVVVAYHAIQWPAAHALLRRHPGAQLWYCRWDRYEAAHDAGATDELLAAWHRVTAEASSLIFAVSGRLAELEREAGREAIVVGLSADSFPSGPLLPGGDLGPGAALVAAARAGGGGRAATTGAADEPTDGGPRAPAAPVAVSLGHLGHRTDWRLLREAVERVADLELLLIGAWHDDEVGEDPDYRWLRASRQVVWLGALDDGDAAAVIAEADVGLVPFLVDPFNDAGLPTRILKYARLGRPTLSPPLAGARTWERATTFVDGPDALAAALRTHAGRRATPDEALRTWALSQTAAQMNAPLLERLAAG